MTPSRNPHAGLPITDDDATIAAALDVIRDYRDRGSVPADPPSPELIREMMSFLVCEDVPEEYVPMLLEEMDLDGVDARTPASPSGTDLAAAPLRYAARQLIRTGRGRRGVRRRR